jgi:hypothetical protein
MSTQRRYMVCNPQGSMECPTLESAESYAHSIRKLGAKSVRIRYEHSNEHGGWNLVWSQCPLCGQRISDGEPCGCGAR